MKLVAAAKLRRAQERILAARPYANKMAELLGNLVSAADGGEGSAHPLLEQREGPRRQVVIITADRGLAGAFNSNVLRNSLVFVRGSSATDITLVVVGRKARDFYRRRPYTVKRDLLGFWDRLADSPPRELADFFIAPYPPGEGGEGHLISNELRPGARPRPGRPPPLPNPHTEGR